MTDEALRPRRKVCVVTATRAEYGLLYWLLLALRDDPKIELQLVVTGAHLSPLHGLTVRGIEADGFAIAARVTMLLHEDDAVGVTKSLGLATLGFADAFARLSPDVLVLLGDRYETLGAAQAALIARIPIAHIHGGETTEGAIDDAIRHALTKMAHLHFVAAAPFRDRVVQLGEDPGKVWIVGALGLDNIARLPLLDRTALEAQLGLPLGKPSLLVTYHPATLANENPAEAMQSLLDAIDGLAETIILTGSNADTGSNAIREVAQHFASTRRERVLYAESLGALCYLSAMMHVDAVVGNSSSGLLEAPSMGTPTVDIGERQKGRLRAPSVIHCSAEAVAIKQAVMQVLSSGYREQAALKRTPYGKSGAADRIATILREHPLEGLLLKRFNDMPARTE